MQGGDERLAFEARLRVAVHGAVFDVFSQAGDHVEPFGLGVFAVRDALELTAEEAKAIRIAVRKLKRTFGSFNRLAAMKRARSAASRATPG
ncbi:hypothetical protein [Polyangium jinanense]|uniref:hypothetical protein n=1 Tax=Polyangium jinanense TaxID=2829994 RepID=UPI0023407CA6|nr:hypothetical protein [Polyangium jinanense]MDC3962766.1 hypothetical protein [Polyangium jinanense]